MTINPKLVLLFTVVFFSCSSGKGNKGNGADTSSNAFVAVSAYDHSLEKGKVTDSVICTKQASQSYALYLPSYYSPDKKYPCIYFFDAHARGAMPLNKYKSIAEKYGFVMVGSNMSKNGISWQTIDDGISAMMEDTKARINIDNTRLYTAGFSGGSRVASSLAIMDGGIAGVIGCAAGFPQYGQEIQNKFDYFGMVGDYDFNLTEMERLDATLEQNGFAHQLLTLPGKHGWAPAPDFETALLWIQVNAMKRSLQPKNDTLLTALKNDYDKRIKEATSAGEWIKEQELLQGMIKVLDGLTDVSIYRKQSASLAQQAEYKNALTVQSQIQTVELNEQQDLMQQFMTQDAQWWVKKIAELNQRATNSATKQEGLMNQRLLNYLGLVGYMATNRALNSGDLANAATYLKIFKMADPENPDCSFFNAVYNMKNGNKPMALAALNEAAKLNYSEASLLITTPEFSSLQGDEEFKKIVDKVRANGNGE